MKFFARSSLMGAGVGLLLMTAAPSFANVSGILNLGGTGSVQVTNTGITFFENAGAGASAYVGSGTNLSFSGGTLTYVSATTDPIQINGGAPITAGSIPLSNFMTFMPEAPGLTATLDSFGAGSSNHTCTGLTSGESCSLPGSPIILTYTGLGTEGTTYPNLGTSALLPVFGTITDMSGKVSSFDGSFSANIPSQTPASLEALFGSSSSASFETTYAGSFVATPPSTVPEPRTVSVVAIAGLLMGLVVAKRRKSVA